MANIFLRGYAERTTFSWRGGLHAGNFWRCCHCPRGVLERCCLRAIAEVDSSAEPFSDWELRNGGGGHYDRIRGSRHKPFGAVELFAIDANATDPGNWNFSATPVDPIATVDDLVCPAPTHMMGNVEITSVPPNTSLQPTFDPPPIFAIAKEGLFMSAKIKYTNESLGDVKVIKDFLPSPAKLSFNEEEVKVTLSLSKKALISSSQRQLKITLNISA